MRRRLSRARHRPAGWRARRARKFERRQMSRTLRIIEAGNLSIRRARARDGLQALEQLFSGPLRWSLAFGATDATGRGRPIRLRAGVPTIRDVEHTAKHRRRQRARAARKRNR